MTQAIILAGGFGTRLRSMVEDVPKPMAPINGKPFLSYLLHEIYTQNLITEVILSVHYKHEMISSFFGNSYKSLSLQYVVEESPLGTGGAIKNCANQISSEHPFFVFNGDTFLKFSHQKMYEDHQKQNSLITLALKGMQSCDRYGRVLFNEEKKILSFEASGYKGKGYINAGAYLLNPIIFREFPTTPFSFEKDFLEENIKDLSPLSFPTEDYFIDIGVPEDYLQAMKDFKPID